MDTPAPAPATATQNQIIIETLRSRAGRWVPMPVLARLSKSYNIHTRIDELRHKHGHHIENRTERRPGTTRKRSFYRIPTDH